MTEPDLEVLDGPATRAILADLGTRLHGTLIETVTQPAAARSGRCTPSGW